MAFVLANLMKIGLKNKSYILPSTFFCLAWGITSLGIVAYSNDWIRSEAYYIYATYLNQIGYYEFKMLVVCCLAFVIARISNKRIKFRSPKQYDKRYIDFVSSTLKYVLYAYFVVGMIRLVLVLYVTGFDYQAIRIYYISHRAYFTTFDLNLIRIGSYLMRLSLLYVIIFGLKSGVNGISLKKVFVNFLLFCPYQLSFGGRLFILSYLLPFLFSYMVSYSINIHTQQAKWEKRSKLYLIISFTLFLIVFLQMLKMGDKIDSSSFVEQSSEIFYFSSNAYHLNELWADLPLEYSLGWGQNSIGITSPVYASIQEGWILENKSAAIVVPSIIPDLYLDFGEDFSLVVFFILFYLLESRAMKLMTMFSLKNFMIYIALCISAFGTPASSMSETLKALFLICVVIWLLDKFATRTSHNKRIVKSHLRANRN